jgi:hypothetical protein
VLECAKGAVELFRSLHPGDDAALRISQRQQQVIKGSGDQAALDPRLPPDRRRNVRQIERAVCDGLGRVRWRPPAVPDRKYRRLVARLFFWVIESLAKCDFSVGRKLEIPISSHVNKYQATIACAPGEAVFHSIRTSTNTRTRSQAGSASR